MTVLETLEKDANKCNGARRILHVVVCNARGCENDSFLPRTRIHYHTCVLCLRIPPPAAIDLDYVVFSLNSGASGFLFLSRARAAPILYLAIRYDTIYSTAWIACYIIFLRAPLNGVNGAAYRHVRTYCIIIIKRTLRYLPLAGVCMENARADDRVPLQRSRFS